MALSQRHGSCRWCSSSLDLIPSYIVQKLICHPMLTVPSRTQLYGSYHSTQINASQSYFQMMIPTNECFVIQLLVTTCLIKQLAVNIEDNITYFTVSGSSEWVVLKALIVFSSLIAGLVTASYILIVLD